MINNEIKTKAFLLRDSGYSYKYIESHLAIARSTLSIWFRDRPFSPNAETIKNIKNGPLKSGEKRRNARIARTEVIWSKSHSEIGDITDRDLLMLGIGLYMGEGSKSHEIVRFSNSDPRQIYLIITWFKRVFGLKNHNFSIRIHLYPDTDIKKSEIYWLKVTKLPKKCLRKAQVDYRKNKLSPKKGKLPYGTIHITILAVGEEKFGRELFRRIQGYMLSIFNNFSYMRD